MVSISRTWYNGSYTMAAKPIKSSELHYTMIQFLITIKEKVTTASSSNFPKKLLSLLLLLLSLLLLLLLLSLLLLLLLLLLQNWRENMTRSSLS